MSKRMALLKVLRALARPPVDEEVAHADADKALLDYIDDPEITKAYEAIPKWYA